MLRKIHVARRNIGTSDDSQAHHIQESVAHISVSSLLGEGRRRRREGKRDYGGRDRPGRWEGTREVEQKGRKERL